MVKTTIFHGKATFFHGKTTIFHGKTIMFDVFVARHAIFLHLRLGQGGRSKGCGLVSFKSREEAKRAAGAPVANSSRFETGGSIELMMVNGGWWCLMVPLIDKWFKHH